MLIATAGHIDHENHTHPQPDRRGCGRLKEEKRRGITISLGYAQWLLSCGRSVSVIDVPGHESLIKTMLSGASGIDAVLVVVSAQAGVILKRVSISTHARSSG